MLCSFAISSLIFSLKIGQKMTGIWETGMDECYSLFKKWQNQKRLFLNCKISGQIPFIDHYNIKYYCSFYRDWLIFILSYGWIGCYIPETHSCSASVAGRDRCCNSVLLFYMRRKNSRRFLPTDSKHMMNPYSKVLS